VTADREGVLKKLGELTSQRCGKEGASPDQDAILRHIGVDLAKSGTQTAVSNLLLLFNDMRENTDAKRDVGESIASVSNTAAKWLLLDTMLSSANPDESDASQRALAGMAGVDDIWMIALGYAEAEAPEQKDLMTDTIRHVRNANTIPALIGIVELWQTSPQDRLWLAACDTLGIIGSREATAYLILSLELALENDLAVTRADTVFASLGRVSNPESLDLLLESAGDKHVSEKVRLAAIAALKNFDEAFAALGEIAKTGENPVIQEAAKVSLRLILKNRGRQVAD
jgi:hypothetical protein